MSSKLKFLINLQKFLLIFCLIFDFCGGTKYSCVDYSECYSFFDNATGLYSTVGHYCCGNKCQYDQCADKGWIYAVVGLSIGLVVITLIIIGCFCYSRMPDENQEEALELDGRPAVPHNPDEIQFDPSVYDESVTRRDTSEFPPVYRYPSVLPDYKSRAGTTESIESGSSQMAAAPGNRQLHVVSEEQLAGRLDALLDSNGAQISPTQNADETQHDSAAYSEIQREISDEELPVYRCPSDPPPLYRSRAGTSIDGNIGSHVQPDSAVAFDNPDIPEENFYIQIGEISNNDGFRTPQSGSVLS
ncbi:uncharacterized protein LOC134844707 [Symsagittifera roscoffensis]|uniref:uncharacterized protein LOC134844707 n=1 Tax=Symsagittifera roscoffensis TaxID=84072 RepID=UPI00307CBD2E